MSDICVKIDNLSKRFMVLKRHETAFRTMKSIIKRESMRRELWALKDVSFEVKKGETVGIVGKNGSGKTTLMRILAGIYEKTSGHMHIAYQPAAMFHAFSGLMGDLQVMDNIFLYGATHNISRDYCKKNLHRILEVSGLRKVLFSPLKELSWGQMQRLALSVFFQTPSEFMLFDESMAFLDEAFEDKCFQYFDKLTSSGEKTLIMVSHDMDFIRRYCQKVIWLHEGRVQNIGRADEVIGEYEKFFKKEELRSREHGI